MALVAARCSANGTIVTYDGKGGQEHRHFTWILGGHKIANETDSIVIQLHAALRFQIVVAKPRCPNIHFGNVDGFLEETAATASLPFGSLGIQSVASTVATSGTHTPDQDPILLEQETLGCGSFAVVTRVWDVSTGLEYASKKFINLGRSNRKKEASLIRQSSHDHIVGLHLVVESPWPQLLLEYVPFGNLEDQHRWRKLSENEAITILQQGLSALTFLHEQSPPVVHRDIKPENICVQSRDPLHIKLGDFGLSKASQTLKTMCGTFTYLPPELAKHCKSTPLVNFRYTQAVGIWSFGTVVYQYAYGLPHPDAGSGWSWCKKIVEALDDWESDGLIDLLCNMVVMEARRRLTPHLLAKAVRHKEEARSGAISSTSTLVTLTYSTQEGYKRQRSPDPNAFTGTKKRTNAAQTDRKCHDAKSHAKCYAVSDAYDCMSGHQDATYENVLELLKQTQVGFVGVETLDSHTIALVHDLSQRVEQLNIADLKKHVDHDVERTIITGMYRTKEFILGSLTSSEVANSIADLARHLLHIMDLMGVEPRTSHSCHLGQRASMYSVEAAESVHGKVSMEETVSVEIRPSQISGFHTGFAGMGAISSYDQCLDDEEVPVDP